MASENSTPVGNFFSYPRLSAPVKEEGKELSALDKWSRIGKITLIPLSLATIVSQLAFFFFKNSFDGCGAQASINAVCLGINTVTLVASFYLIYRGAPEEDRLPAVCLSCFSSFSIFLSIFMLVSNSECE